MLNYTILTAKSSVKRVSKYYEDGVDDYYAADGHAKIWQGQGAEILNLSGNVDEGVFSDLLKGHLPNGEKLSGTVRHDSNRRIGIDFTFNAPKSVSMQALIAGDSRIIDAHDKAVTVAMTALEERAAARKKVLGKSYVQNTANLIVAKFRHETNREMEPHLHTHAVTINATQRSDKKWAALLNDELIKNVKYYGAIYKAELAKALEEMGYILRYEQDSFDLAHITREQVMGMSTRLQQVDEKLDEMGLTRENSTSSQRTYAAKSTRKQKDATISRDELIGEWKNKASRLGVDFEKREWSFSDKSLENIKFEDNLKSVADAELAKRAVKFAVNHFSERQTIFTSVKLAEKAIEHGLGRVTKKDILKEIDNLTRKGSLILAEPRYVAINADTRISLTKAQWIEQMVLFGKNKSEAKRQTELAISSGRLLKTESVFTTQKAIDQERRILTRELDGRNTQKSLLSNNDVNKFLTESTLRKDQCRAAELVLTTKNRIIGINGLAGVGKSYLLKEVTDRIKENGMSVHVLAPYGKQKKNLQDDGLTEAKTVASFLHTLSRDHPLGPESIIFIDEAGVLPNRLLDSITELSEKTNTRLVLIGDKGQTKAIEAGTPFDLLQKNGMETALMDEIQRQKENPELLKAVRHAAFGDTDKSISLIHNISEEKDDVVRYKNVANDYLMLDKKEQEKTIVLTGTNYSRKEINTLIRGGLGIEDTVLVTALTRRDSTQAERRYSRYYEPNVTAIMVERDYKSGLKRGEVYIVTEQAPGNKLVVQDERGQKIIINPAHHTKMSVYNIEDQQYGVGDRLVCTRNNASLDIANGDAFKITRITKDGQIYLSGRNDVVLNANEKQHLDYAYVSTVHSAQGLTSEKSILNVETNSLTTSKDWWYVAISRAKTDVIIHTNDKQKLNKAIARKSPKQAAHEIDHKVAKAKEKKADLQKQH
ncbi:conjugative relaxase [Dickeya dadantii]|uniref:MobF family relaxase n=1 Tax=Dickeya dadantii TaxID=204038 RepID=UPI001495584C|nr:MobF family relaxase [Dickeya dadantii]NPE55884.1 conjugative relaxase [Dickeya dadantii]NPE67656.1 conjugative relaxase [Dickeya dadantii]